MGQLDPFDLVKRLGTAPLGPLVDTLRKIHSHGAVTGTPLEDLLGGGKPAPLPPAPPSAAAAPAPDYEAARRHFVRHAEKLREQAVLAERLLDGMAGEVTRAPAMLQQQLRVQCARGATSAARFVVVNCLDRAVDVGFRIGRFHGLSGEQAAAICLSFAPAHPHLEPSADAEVELRVDLAAADGLPEVLEAGVDVLGGDELVLKLWVRIEVRQGGAA